MERRVFFDGNAGDEVDGFLLIFDKSLRDLQSIQAKEGMDVLLCDPGQVEVEARLTFDPEMNCWRGIPTGPYRILD